jgi:hypothetical protein
MGHTEEETKATLEWLLSHDWPLDSCDPGNSVGGHMSCIGVLVMSFICIVMALAVSEWEGK